MKPWREATFIYTHRLSPNIERALATLCKGMCHQHRGSHRCIPLSNFSGNDFSGSVALHLESLLLPVINETDSTEAPARYQRCFVWVTRTATKTIELAKWVILRRYLLLCSCGIAKSSFPCQPQDGGGVAFGPIEGWTLAGLLGFHVVAIAQWPSHNGHYGCDTV